MIIIISLFDDLERRLAEHFQVERFSQSLNVSLPGSGLQVQIQTDERYRAFVANAVQANVLDITLPAARLADVLQGKIWAALDPEQRGSKRQKDLADIARLIERYPHLRCQVPSEILARLEG